MLNLASYKAVMVFVLRSRGGVSQADHQTSKKPCGVWSTNPACVRLVLLCLIDVEEALIMGLVYGSLAA